MSDLHQFYLKTDEERLAILTELFGLSDKEVHALKNPSEGLRESTASTMVENCVGRFSVPVGVATNFIVDGKEIVVPMATEEPSVIAGLSSAGRLCRATGGFTTESTPNICTGQAIFVVPDGIDDPIALVESHMTEITDVATEATQRMRRHGGGLSSIGRRVVDTDSGKMVIIDINVNVMESMGANLVTVAAERTKEMLSAKLGFTPLMGTITNFSDKRIISAKARWPLGGLGRSNYTGRDVADRIVQATSLARVDHARAATHRKGIMNGVTSVVLVTGNDTRAVEAAVHAYALAPKGNPALTNFWIDGDDLVGEIRMPVPIGNVGGSIKRNVVSMTARKLMKVETVNDLANVIAAVGLAQNFAALRALVTEGISVGHMKLHSRNIACEAGADEDEIAVVASKLITSGSITVANAEVMLRQLRERQVPS